MARTGRLTRQLEIAYRLRYRRFLRVAIAIVGDEESGHEAVQEGFATALREQQSFRGDGPLEAWVWRMVVNAALAVLRRRETPTDGSVAAEAASANGHASDETGVRAWVAALPERQRLAVYLRYYADTGAQRHSRSDRSSSRGLAGEAAGLGQCSGMTPEVVLLAPLPYA